MQRILPGNLSKFLLLAIFTIFVNYLAPAIIKNLWFITLIVFYLRSQDEAFWLAFFLILNDGFAGFFGIRSANIDSIGLIPEFEVAHIYLIAAFYKITRAKDIFREFYSDFLRLIIIYILFLFIYGISQGLSDDYNLLLRNIRNIFPLFLIFLLPRMLKNSENFERFFSFIFLISIVSFIAQLFSIITGQSPMAFLGFEEATTTVLTEVQPWRYFYNVSANLIAFFASLFYLSIRKNVFNRLYLQIVIAMVLGTIFLSATRGWMLGFGLSMILYFLFVQRVNFKNMIIFTIISAVLIQLALFNPIIRVQARASINRFLTVESVTEGDMTAGGTSSRTTEQSPRVLAVWQERPLFGWGFSDTYYENQNGHVGNENILLHSGVAGGLLMLLYFLYFHYKLLTLRNIRKEVNPFHQSVIVFPVFFIGWFIIHSTSGQHFAFMGSYYLVFAQAVYFGFGATIYRECRKLNIESIHLSVSR